MEPIYIAIAAAAAWLLFGGESAAPSQQADLDAPTPKEAEDRYADL